MLLLAASQQSDLHLGVAGLIAGVVLGGLGHITRLRWLIVLGILLIGLDTVLFAFVVRPGAG